MLKRGIAKCEEIPRPFGSRDGSSAAILGIDTSCDETSIAVLDLNGSVLANIVSSQIKTHAAFGGVVPELASRAHVENISFVYGESLRAAGIEEKTLAAVAVTFTPGLIGCLLTGLSFAKGVSYRLDIPLWGVNHLQAHLLSPFIEMGDIPHPFLGLVVSGGHTAFYRVEAASAVSLLGQTVDDAAGEAFDKCAKLLNLAYPGGPLVEKLALTGNEKAFPFTKARVKMGEAYLSFSGLKTALGRHVRDCQGELSGAVVSDLCASVQKGIVDTLTDKLAFFLRRGEYVGFALSGGVAVNKRLRAEVESLCREFKLPCYLAKPEFCTDNGAMIAFAGLLGEKKDGKFSLEAVASQRVQARALKNEKTHSKARERAAPQGHPQQ